MFGEKLKQLRIQQSLTLQQLADNLGTTPITLSRYEREERQPDFNTLLKLAHYFNVSTDYLLGVSNLKNPLDLKPYISLLEENGFFEDLFKYFTNKDLLIKRIDDCLNENNKLADVVCENNIVYDESYIQDTINDLNNPAKLFKQLPEDMKLNILFSLLKDISVSNDDINVTLRDFQTDTQLFEKVQATQELLDIIKDYPIDKIKALITVAAAMG